MFLLQGKLYSKKKYPKSWRISKHIETVCRISFEKFQQYKILSSLVASITCTQFYPCAISSLKHSAGKKIIESNSVIKINKKQNKTKQNNGFTILTGAVDTVKENQYDCMFNCFFLPVLCSICNSNAPRVKILNFN